MIIDKFIILHVTINKLSFSEALLYLKRLILGIRFLTFSSETFIGLKLPTIWELLFSSGIGSGTQSDQIATMQVAANKTICLKFIIYF